MNEKKRRGFGPPSRIGALGRLGRLTKLGRVVRREGVGGLVRQVLSGEALAGDETQGRGSDSEVSPDREGSRRLGQDHGRGPAVREEELNQEVENLRKALEQAKLDLLGQTTKLKNDIFDLKKRNSELLEQVVQLTKRERDLSKQILDAQFQGSGHKADKKKLEIEVRDLKRAVKEAEERAEAAEAKVKLLEDAAMNEGGDASLTGGEKSDPVAKPVSIDQQSKPLEAASIEQLEDALARTRLDVKQRDEQIVDMEQRIEKMELRLADIRRTLTDREEKIRSLRAAGARMEKQLGGLRAENQGLMNEVARLRRVQARATEERKRIREASRTSQLKTLQSAVSEIQNAVIELRDVVDEGALAVTEFPPAEEETPGETKS